MVKRIPFNSHEYWETRDRVFRRDNGRCQSPHCQDMPEWFLCGREFNVDHIVPISKGGTNDDSNLRVLCEFCHACRDDSGLGGEWNSHKKLGLLYVLTGRIEEKVLKQYQW